MAVHPYSFAGGVAGMAADVEGVRSYLDALGASEKSLWITEMGWPTNGTVPAGETVDEDELASLLTESFNWVKLNAAADDIRLAAWYNVRDFGGATWDGYAGLQGEDGSYHPAWYAFQEQTGAERSGDVWAAFQAETGTLWIYSTAGGYADTGLAMQPGASPTVTTSPGGGALVAFTAADGQPEAYSTATGTLSQSLAPPPEVAPGTVAPPGNLLAAALKAYVSALLTSPEAGSAFEAPVHLAPGTTPSVATVP